VRKLSLGERMKCELMAALLHRPQVLFLDEPTLGLDVNAQAAVRRFLRDYNERHRATILLTSHYMADITALSERVLLIHRGHLIYDGDLPSLTDRFAPYRLIQVELREPRERAAAGGTFGMTPLELARYFLAVFLARQATFVWVIWEFEREVVEGRLSSRLLQPMDPGWHYFSSHISERAARFPIAIGLVVLFFVLYPRALWVPSAFDLVAFVVVVSGVFVLRFLIQYTLAMLAFWTERAASLEGFFWLLYLVLSGLIAPLEVFPAAVRTVALYTPFPYLVHFPAQVLIGQPVDWAQALAVTTGWGVTFLVLNRWLWRRGLRHYSAMGA
jgi:ABC-2 type transport system permease protein